MIRVPALTNNAVKYIMRLTDHTGKLGISFTGFHAFHHRAAFNHQFFQCSLRFFFLESSRNRGLLPFLGSLEQLSSTFAQRGQVTLFSRVEST